MICEADYYRRAPETEGELVRFAELPPNLRAMARTRFSSCSVEVERCQDPIARARDYLRGAVGLDVPPTAAATIDWNGYRKLPDGKSAPRPGWTSTVNFNLSG